jgi:hypothetical protein
MRKQLWIGVLTLSMATGVLSGCSDQTSSPRFGTMNVRMTDAPGDYEHVNLVVTQVSARMEGVDSTEADTTGGWVVLNNTAATYDLVTLQNGIFTTIGTGLVPAGRYTQLRLKIGTGSTVVVDGVSHPLVVPSGAQSGLKLVGAFDVPASGVVDVALDFDAQRSIVLTGAGTYLLKPVIRVLPTTASGAITGTIAPAGTPATIYALQASDTLGSARAADDGRFTLAVLASGLYAVGIRPDSAYRDTTLTNVSVSAGSTTDLGTVQLTHQ